MGLHLREHFSYLLYINYGFLFLFLMAFFPVSNSPLPVMFFLLDILSTGDEKLVQVISKYSVLMKGAGRAS